MASVKQPASSAVDYLEHYGIKGMKWGVIKDHVFNKAGTKETADAASKIKAKGEHQKNRETVKSKRILDLSPSKDHSDAAFVKKKAKISGVHTLSNQDLNTVISRMNLEVQYKNLKTVQHNQSLIGKGTQAATGFLSRVGGDILVNVGSSWLKRPGSRTPSGSTRVRSYVGGQPTIQGSYTQNSLGS